MIGTRNTCQTTFLKIDEIFDNTFIKKVIPCIDEVKYGLFDNTKSRNKRKQTNGRTRKRMKEEPQLNQFHQFNSNTIKLHVHCASVEVWVLLVSFEKELHMMEV